MLGIETTGYLNNHTERNISNIKITKEEAKKNLNKDLQIESEGMLLFQQNGKQKYFVMNQGKS